MRPLPNACFAVLLACLMIGPGCRSAPTSRTASLGRARVVDREFEMRTRAHAHYATAVIHEVNDEPELALQEFYQAALDDLGNESLLLDVTRRLMLGRQTEKAVELLDLATRLRGATGAMFARLGLACQQLGRNEQAIEASLKAVKKSPRDLAGYQNLFHVYLLENRNEDAGLILAAAAGEPGTDAEFLAGLSELYAAYLLRFPSKRDEVKPMALAVLDKAAALDPETTMLRLRLGDGYLMLGKGERAAVFYEQALEGLAHTPILRDTIQTKLTEIYLGEHDYERAVKHLENLVRDDPSNARGYHLLGAIAADEKRWADAAENLEKAILFNPKFEQAYYELASARIAANEPAKAVATLESARSRFPSSFLMEYLSGVAYSQSKAYSEAVERFTTAEILAKASETNRLTDGFYFQFGMACERKGDPAQAATHFRRAIEINADFAEALNYLGYMWAERGENLEEAKSLIERALKVAPENSAYLDSLGWVLFRLGHPEAALEYVLKAIERTEEPNAELYSHLGDIYEALQRTAEAVKAWQQSLQLEPNPALEKKVKSASPR
jgi:tetratricopeptide (TPR) repeat protein